MNSTCIRILVPVVVCLVWSMWPGREAGSAVPRVGYLDVEDRYSGKLKLKEALVRAGVRPRQIRASGFLVGRDYDVIVLGSFVTSDRKVRSFLKRNRGRLTRFVEKGGVLVALAQAWYDEGEPLWLPEGLSARRSDRDSVRARFSVAGAGSALGAGVSAEEIMAMDLYRGRRYYSSGVYGAVDLFGATRGFLALLEEDSSHPLPIVLLGKAAKGAVVLASLAPDLACVAGSSEAVRQTGCRFIAGLLGLALDAELLAGAQVAPDFASLDGELEVEVYLDVDGNGRRDGMEVGLAGLVVTHGFEDHLTGEAGTVIVQADPAFPRSLFVRIPEGYSASSKWHYATADPGRISIGLSPGRSAQPAGPPVIVQLTDIHVGRNGPPEEEAALLSHFLRRLEHRVAPGALFALTGDVTHTGAAAQIAAFNSALENLRDPVMVTMGNHDEGLGPDVGRLFREEVAPVFYTREWRGHLVVSVPRLDLPKKKRAWLEQTIAGSDRPVVLLTHFYPLRRDLDRLDLARVKLLVSGHWHGDLVTRYRGVTSVNSPPALIGGWDFSPASGRVITLGEGGPITELVPFARGKRAVAVRAGRDKLLVNTVGGAGTPPLCSRDGATVAMEKESAFSWAGTAAGAISCTREEEPVAQGAQVEWAVALPGRSLAARPLQYRDAVLVPLRNKPGGSGQGAVCAVDAGTGDVRWCAETGAAALSPVAVSGTVVVTDVAGVSSGLAFSSGELVWTTPLERGSEPRFASHYVHTPGVRHKSVVYYCYQAGPFGLDIRSGKLVWTGGKYGGEDAFNHARGLVVDGRLLCGSFLGGIYAFDLDREGAEPVKIESSWRTTSDFVKHRGVWTLSRNRLARLDPYKGVEGGVAVPYAVLPAEPVIGDGYAVVRDGHQGVLRVSLGSGKKRWRASFPEGPICFALNKHHSAGLIGSPVALGGNLAVPGVDGVLRVLDVSSGELQESHDFGVPLVSTPVWNKLGLFVVDYGGVLYRVR